MVDQLGEEGEKEEEKREKISKESMRRMADLLMRGATLLDKACPVCSTPLYQLPNGEIWCVNCDKRVVIVKEGEREGPILKPLLWEELEDTLLMKLRDVNSRMRSEEEPGELQRLISLISSLLEAFENLKKVKTD